MRPRRLDPSNWSYSLASAHMTTVQDIFARSRPARRGLLLPFFTAGDPDITTTMRLLGAAERAGAEIAELGIPFSDPIADGPVIAESMHDALGRGVTPHAILDAIRTMRDSGAPGSRIAIMAMLSVSILYRMGFQRFVDAAAEAGIAGLIVPDIDLSVAPTLTAACDTRGLACVYLVAPTTTPERLRALLPLCRGFVYVLARAGITGESAELPDIAQKVEAIRAIAPDLGIAAGFGVATREQVAAVLSYADGAIVGSALVRQIANELKAGRDPVVAIEATLRSLTADSQAPNSV